MCCAVVGVNDRIANQRKSDILVATRSQHRPISMKLTYQKHGFSVALALIAAANSILFLYLVEKASIRVPVYDLLDMLQFYGERSQANDWLGYLWTPHNEHRMVWSWILLAIDVKWFHGGGTANASFGLLLLIAMVVLVSLEILKSNLSISWKVTAIPIVIMLLTPANIVPVISMTPMSNHLHGSAFVVFSVLLLDGANEQSRFSNYRRVAAIIAGGLAAFGSAAALLIWPVLVWTAWRGGLGWRWIASIACVGSLFIPLYLWGLPSPPISLSLDVDHVFRTLDYALRFLGLPWSHMHQLVWPARLIGAGILCIGGVLVINDSLFAYPNTPLKRFGLSLILFTLLVTISAALARVDFAEDREMPIRYGMVVLLAHLGLLLWSLDFLERYWHGAYRRSFQWLLVGISLTWFGQQIVVGHFAVGEAKRYNDAWSRFVAGDWTPDMSHYVYPDRERAQAGLAYLRKNGLLNTTN